MKFMKFLDFYGKIMKIREIMHFSPLFRIWGHKYPSKVIKMLTNTIHFHSWLSRCPIFAKKAEMLIFHAKNEKTNCFHEISIIFIERAIFAIFAISWPPGSPGGSRGGGKGPPRAPDPEFWKVRNVKKPLPPTRTHTWSNARTIYNAVIY